MQTELKDVFFTGEIVTLSPLTYTTPDLDKKSVLPGQLPRMNQKLYLPATMIRGRLRRLARDIVREGLSDKEDHLFKLSDFILNTLGGVKSSDKEDDPQSLVERLQRVRAKNPLVSLFGAMAPSTVPGKTAIGHAIATEGIPAVHFYHTRTDDLHRDPDTIDMMDCNAMQEYLALTSEADERSKIKAEMKVLEAEMKKLDKSDSEKREGLRAKINELKEASKTAHKQVQIQQPLDYQAIPQGVTLKSDFRLMRATDDEIALFVQALSRLALNPVFGGRLNHGNGQVKGSWKVEFRPSGSNKRQTAGAISFEGDFMSATVTGDTLAGWANRALPWSDLDFSENLIKSAA